MTLQKNKTPKPLEDLLGSKVWVLDLTAAHPTAPIGECEVVCAEVSVAAASPFLQSIAIQGVVGVSPDGEEYLQAYFMKDFDWFTSKKAAKKFIKHLSDEIAEDAWWNQRAEFSELYHEDRTVVS